MSDEDTSGDDAKGTVPTHRLTTMAAQKRELAASLAQVTAERDSYKAKAAEIESWQKKYGDLEATFAAHKQTWEDTDAARSAGLADSEGVEVARLFHGKLPEKDRPAFGAWVSDLAKEPGKAPKALQAYFVKEVAKPAGKEVKQVAKLPPSGGGGSAAASTGEVSAADVRAASQEGQLTGDWSAYKALQAKLNAARTRKITLP